MNSFAAIAAGLLRVGHDAKTARSPYQFERAGLALGGGRRGVVPPQGNSLPPQENDANTSRSPYQFERADLALGGGRRGVVPLQESK